MKRIEIEIKGTTPLLTHRMPSEDLMALIPNLKMEKKKNKVEMTPREIAERHAYKFNDKFCIPTTSLIGAIKHVSSDYKQKSSSKKSLKGVVNGAIRPENEFAEILDENMKPHASFEVDIRQARNHQKGAVAVCRPRWDAWNLKTILVIDDSILPADTVHEMLNDAGKRSGIGSFRVSNSGWFGQYLVSEFRELDD